MRDLEWARYQGITQSPPPAKSTQMFALSFDNLGFINHAHNENGHNGVKLLYSFGSENLWKVLLTVQAMDRWCQFEGVFATDGLGSGPEGAQNEDK